MDLKKLEKLHELKEKGILSEEEFKKEKQKLMSDATEEVFSKPDEDVYEDCSHFGVIKGSFCAFICSLMRWNDFRGRTSRFDFWGANLYIVLLCIVFEISAFFIALLGENGEIINEILTIIYNVFIYWLLITLEIRRLHDVNKSGWWVITLVVPLCIVFFKGDAETNRFGRAFKTNEKRAATLLFLQIVCFVLCFLVGALSGFTSEFRRFKETKTIDQIQTMASNIRTLFDHQKNYNGIEKSSMMYQFGIYTDDICGNERCINPINPYGGSITLEPLNDINGFAIIYDGLPKDGCVKMITTEWGGSSRGFLGLSINPPNGASFTSPASRQNAENICNTEKNKIVLIFE